VAQFTMSYKTEAKGMLQSLRLGLTFDTNIVNSLEILASAMTMDMGIVQVNEEGLQQQAPI
jgi:hypothetical protein